MLKNNVLFVKLNENTHLRLRLGYNRHVSWNLALETFTNAIKGEKHYGASLSTWSLGTALLSPKNFRTLSSDTEKISDFKSALALK